MTRYRNIVIALVLLLGGLLAGVFASGKGLEAWQEAFGKEEPAIIEIPSSVRPAEQISFDPDPIMPEARPAEKQAPPAPISKTIATKTDEACDVSAAYPPVRWVVLNEIAWMATPQWLELKNITRNTVDISGWQILDRDGNPLAIINDKNLIGPNQFLVLDELLGELHAGGQWLKLFDSKCRLMDEIQAGDSWPGGEIFSGRTLERKLDISGWQTSFAPEGSRGEESSDGLPRPLPTLDRSGSIGSGPAVPSVELQPPVIARVRITGGPGRSEEDAVRIYNPNPEPQAIGGWQLKKRTRSGTESTLKTFLEAAAIPGRGYYVWANSKLIDAGADETSSQTIAADNGVALYDAAGRRISEVFWGENSPYPNPGPGEWLDFQAGLTPE